MLELINVLKTNPDHAFDYISNNAHNFPKDELKDIIKELLYAIYTSTDTMTHDTILKEAGKNLEEWYAD